MTDAPEKTIADIDAILKACDYAYDALDRKRFPVLAKALIERQNRLMMQRAEYRNDNTTTPQISHD